MKTRRETMLISKQASKQARYNCALFAVNKSKFLDQQANCVHLTGYNSPVFLYLEQYIFRKYVFHMTFCIATKCGIKMCLILHGVFFEIGRTNAKI